MRRVIALACFTLLMLFSSGTECPAAWFWGPPTVATINGESFSADDVRDWWKNWQEEGDEFPETAEPFVNWILLASEAEQMELFREPSFQHKIEVFLKARTLLIYKREKINDRLNIDDPALQEYYRENYLPRLKLHILYFNDKDVAQAAHDLLVKGDVSMQQYADEAARKDPHDAFYEERITRLKQLRPEWVPVYEKLSVGEMSEPFAWNKGFVIIRYQDRLAGDPEDFEKLRNMMTNELRKIREAELTEELVNELIEKYMVEIDWQLLDQLDLGNVDEELLDRPLITIGEDVYPVKVYLAQVQKEKSFSEKYGFEVAEQAKLKKKIMNGIIAQTLTSRAALDEHYEEREPLRPLYQFYRQHRLIKELEKRLFLPQAEVTPEEVRQYYDENLEMFSQPEMVSLALVEDEEKLVDKMYGEMKRGLDFFTVAAHYYTEEIPVKRMQLNRLAPVVQEKLDKMATGEISEPFMVNDHYIILKLVQRVPITPMPFDHVQEKITEMLKEEKISAARNDFLKALKERSDITVSEKAWNNVKKEFGDLNGRKAD